MGMTRGESRELSRIASRRTRAEPLVAAEVGRVRFDGRKVAWLWFLSLSGLWVGAPSLTRTTLGVSLGLAFLTLCVGHSVGLHRGIIHRTYETTVITRGVLAYLFVLSGLGGPISWARLHAIRDYWQNRPDCPRYFAYRHSMLEDFVWNLHMRFEPADGRADERLPPDVLADRWLLFLERTWPLHVMALAVAMLPVLGAGGVAVCVCARSAAGVVGHWAVGYAAHKWGARRFVLPGAAESGTNVWLLGVLSFGEGFHNNHHALPKSARMGIRPWDIDLGWMVVWLLERLSLVHGVRAWHRAGGRAPARRGVHSFVAPSPRLEEGFAAGSGRDEATVRRAGAPSSDSRSAA
jgi:stearoyl-CoA desaturase (delta-9 desaturase)